MKFLVRQTPDLPIKVVDSDKLVHTSPFSGSEKPYVYFPEINAGADPDYYNENENVRPVTADTAFALDVIDNAITNLKATLESLQRDRRELLGQAYQMQKQRVFFYQDDTWKVEKI